LISVLHSRRGFILISKKDFDIQKETRRNTQTKKKHASCIYHQPEKNHAAIELRVKTGTNWGFDYLASTNLE
jgi:hypothetical protein